jgi:hypothetical protein
MMADETVARKAAPIKVVDFDPRSRGHIVARCANIGAIGTPG